DLLFLFTHHAPPPTSTLSLHDALPICPRRQRVELRPIAEAGDPAAPRGVAELLAHRVAAWALDVQAEGDDQSTLLRGQAAEGGVRAGESLGPQCRIERARCGESLAACPARRIGGIAARVIVGE